MRDSRSWIVWLVVFGAVAAGFVFRHTLYVWLLRMHGVHAQ